MSFACSLIEKDLRQREVISANWLPVMAFGAEDGGSPYKGQVEKKELAHTKDDCLGDNVLEVTDSRDSCYDSGDDTESMSTHENVSRTVSDTLGAELADETNSACLEQRLSESLGDMEYASRVEKVVKLGYTEALLQQALEKLGCDASDNDVLQELIKLGQTNKPSDLDLPTSILPMDTTLLSRPSIADESSNLRPIVIDGSNVAMRQVAL